MFVMSENGKLQTSTSAAIASERLRRLANDLDALALGTMPSTLVLSSAPRIDNWMTATVPSPVLLGMVEGHPDHPDREEAMATSELWVDGSRLGWVRTLSRYYRLGRPTDSRFPQEF